MQRSFHLFENSIHSPETKKIYTWAINKFMKFYKLKDYDSLASMDGKMLQVMVEDYVMALKNEGKKKGSILTPVIALELFCDTNDLVINWKKIRRLLPPATKKTGSKAYTTAQVRKILEFETKIRNKAIIHFVAASGVRIGALPDLKIKHVRNIEDCKLVTVYPEDKEEYYTFLTPEASSVLDEYLEKRKTDGEYLNPDSPLFRQNYSLGIAKPKPISKTGYQAMMNRSLRRCGLRSGYSKQRRDIQLDHGFRKRWNTIVKTTDGIKLILAEKMMGHTIKSIPLDETYLDPTIEKLFEEYKKTIQELTIDDSERNKIEIENQNRKISDLEEKTNRIEELEKKAEEKDKEYQKRFKMLERIKFENN